MVYRKKSGPLILLFLLPVSLVYLAFMVLPVVGSFVFSLYNWTGVQGAPLVFAGLDNFAVMAGSDDFWQSIQNIVWFVVLSVALQIPFGYALAFVIHGSRRFTRFLKASFFLPLILPVTATAILWNFLLYPNETGIFNQILAWFGIESVQWLVDSGTALNSIIVYTAWSSVGYYMIIGLAALTNVPNEILEAATIDGAGRFTKIFRIILPMLRESIILSVIFVTSGIFKIFDPVYVMTGGGPNGLTNVPATLMYNESFKFAHFGMGSAISVVIFVMSLGTTILTLWVSRKKDES
jgi:raffinose/stachyose/melibiose transport system permease protein